MTRGLFVLGYPVLDDNGELYLGDACYQQTFEICRPFLDEVIVVARLRTLNRSAVSLTRLSDVNAHLGLELPDFGASDRTDWLNVIRLLFVPRLETSLRYLVQNADFVYVEAPSLEAYLAARVARQVGRYLTMEMRGEVVLNRQYMRQRFGRRGLAYALLFQSMFKVIRRQVLAGLYVNRFLMQHYPVAGAYLEAISDAQLPDELYSQPRKFVGPARRFLCVGHLEKVKRVDLLLRVLQLAQDQLSADWACDVVGDGPELTELIRLARRLDLESRVKFHGRVAWGTPLFKLYHEADLLLMTSLTEGTSRTLLEALAAALPVLSTAVGQASELLDSYALVPVDDLKGYAQRLVRIAADPDLLTRLSYQNWQQAQAFALSDLISRRRAFFAQAIELSARQSVS